MHRFIVLTILLSACIGHDSESPTTSSVGASDPTDPPEPLPGPRIVGVKWHWIGCGPTATALPFSLVVDVDVASPDDTYKVKGQAVGCDAFNGNGQVRPCTGHPAAVIRALTVAAGDATGGETHTIGLTDCVDGKWQP